MQPISILLLRGKVPTEDLSSLSSILECSVMGCVVADDGEEGASVNTAAFSEAERDSTSVALYTLYRIVSTPEDVENPLTFARSRIRRLRDVIRDIEDAIDEGDEPGIVQAAEMARYEAEGFCFAMEAWSAR